MYAYYIDTTYAKHVVNVFMTDVVVDIVVEVAEDTKNSFAFLPSAYNIIIYENFFFCRC